MGYYVQGPTKGKAEHIFHMEEARAILLDEAPEWPAPASRAIVCVVDNGPFEAAGFCFCERELEAFSSPGDPRPRVWLEVDLDWVIQETGIPREVLSQTSD